MSAEWQYRTWGEIATLEYGKALQGYTDAAGAYPVYGTNGRIGSHHVALCPHPGIIIGRKGAYRGTHYSASPFFVIDTAFYLEPKQDMDMRWAYYEILTHDINHLDSGSAIPSTSRADFYSLPVLVPPLSEQHAIACVLGAFDDKIELNRRMNETLEAIARALFQSWFVDFDPVRAKAEGRQLTGMDAEIASLLPDGFEESIIGAIPHGWRVGTLGEITSNMRRGILPEEVAPSTPYIGLEHMPRRSISLEEWGTAADIASNKFWFETGEILFGKLRPYFHKVGVAPVDGVCSTDILVLAPKGDDWFGYLLSHLSSDDFIAYVTARADGTRMPRASWSDVAAYQVILPSKQLAAAFTRHMEPVVKSIRANILHTQTLAQTRDVLLPKLLSGEVRVKEAERLIEAHV